MAQQHISDQVTPSWFDRTLFHDDANDLVCCYYHIVNSEIGLHSSNYFELNIVTSGNGTHIIGNEEIPVSIGYVAVIPPTLNHGYINNENLSVFHAIIHSSFFERYMQEFSSLPGFYLLFEISPFISQKNPKAVSFRLSEEDMDEISYDIGKLVSLKDSSYSGKYVHTASRMVCLIASLSFCFHKINRNVDILPNPNIHRVLRSMEYIRIHYGDEISINELINKTNMSRSTYVRLFKQLTGSTPHDFILRCRIINARRFLSFSDLPIVTIAQNCGFCDNSHFTRVFLQYEHITPIAYRQLHSGNLRYSACMLPSFIN